VKPGAWIPFAARVAALTALLAGLGGCALTRPDEAPPLRPVQAFEPLPASPARVATRSLSGEARFAGLSGVEIEARTRALADVHVGSFLGQPTGAVSATARSVRIHHRSYLHRAETRGGLILVAGFTEGVAHYQELIHDLVAQGWSVYMHDHRGQGFSTRLLAAPQDADKGHIDQFDHLVADLGQFVQAVRARRAGKPGPLVALAHSMGGAVLALHLARERHDTPLAAAALVTPMFEPTIAGTGVDAAAGRWCDRYAVHLPMQLPWLSTPRVQGEPFDQARAAYEARAARGLGLENDLTHSVPRLLRRWADRALTCEAMTDATSRVHCGHVNAKVEGPTLRWVAQACSAAREARGPRAADITVPLLLLQGGQDSVVEPMAQQLFCARVAGCRGWVLPQARHGIFYEEDTLRGPALAAVLDFFDEVAPSNAITRAQPAGPAARGSLR